MEETGVGSQEGVRGFRIRVGGGERKEGERDGFLAGGCVGLELMMYCASFSPTACFPARFMWRPCRVKCFTERKFISKSVTSVSLSCSFSCWFACLISLQSVGLLYQKGRVETTMFVFWAARCNLSTCSSGVK